MPASTRVLKFWTDYKNKGGKVVPIDMVELCAVGQADRSTWRTPVSVFTKRLRPVADPVNDQAAVMMHEIWSVVEPQYNAWKQGHEIPETGTPIGAWPGVSPEQAQVLRNAGFKSVEELANATDSAINRIQLPGARTLAENAKRFIAAQDKATVVNELAAKDAEITSLKDQLEELRQIVLSKMNDDDEAPKRRGRPPKVETELPAA